MTFPRLVLVSGPPGAGRTGLAHSLGRLLRLPVVSCNEIEEGLVNRRTEGIWGPPIAQESFALFYRIVDEYIASGCSVVAEAAFRTDFVQETAKILLQADAWIVHCHVDKALARQRFMDRAATDPERVQAHLDWEIVEADWDKYDLMDLGVPCLRVDTITGYAPTLDDIEVFIRAQ
jgi:predicted kinase